MADSGRTVFGGGAPSAGLRVPPAAETGVTLARSTSIPLTVGQTSQLTWTDDDELGEALAAGAIAYPGQKLTLTAAHNELECDDDGYYQFETIINLTAGASGASVSVRTPESSREHLTIVADGLDSARHNAIWPFANRTIIVQVTCLSGSVTVGFSTLYVKRLSE